MRKLLFLFLCIPFSGNAQLQIGVKAGINFVDVTNTAGINADSRSGYMIGGYIAPRPQKLIGFRTELMLSRQGYDYKTNTNTGTVNLDYLLLPQLITFNFSKRVELHLGGQAAFLLNAAADSSGGSESSLFKYFNRFDYGVVGGVQITPFKGLFIGGRFNASLNNLNKEQQTGNGGSPGFVPKEFIKNNVLQLYAGWRF